jgi:GT2 family glycosyltransferase
MGATHYSLPLPPRTNTKSFRSPKIEPRKIRVVIPVYKDWQGLKTTLDSLQALNPRPGAITVANDNADYHIPEWLKSYPIKIVNYRANRGPAHARNKGSGNPDTGFDWIYFTDCGCEHVRDIIRQFVNAQERVGDSIVAICGSVAGKGPGKINRYMTEMDILNPPFEKDLGHSGEKIPQAIITANTLVYAPAFHQLGGFSTAFSGAGGEDLDFGIRLRELGRLVFAPHAAVSHEFDEDIQDFKRRFERYGRGNRLLEQKHKLPSLRPKPFLPKNPEFNDLAELQIESLCRGYDQAKLENTMRFPARSLKRVALKILKG